MAKREPAPTTSIRLSRRDKQVIRIAAAIFNMPYQTYMRRVALAHAEQIINSQPSGKIKIRPITRRELTSND